VDFHPGRISVTGKRLKSLGLALEGSGGGEESRKSIPDYIRNTIQLKTQSQMRRERPPGTVPGRREKRLKYSSTHRINSSGSEKLLGIINKGSPNSE